MFLYRVSQKFNSKMSLSPQLYDPKIKLDFPSEDNFLIISPNMKLVISFINMLLMFCKNVELKA